MEKLIHKDPETGELSCNVRDFDKFFPLLHAYEETGMTPDDIKSMRDRYYVILGMGHRKMNRLVAMAKILGDDYDIDHLRELMEAEREGRLQVLPDKAVYEQQGDSVYIIDDGEIVDVILGPIQMNTDGVLMAGLCAEDAIFPYREPDPEIDTEPTDWCSNFLDVPICEFGKTVFFTEEEAEAALAKEVRP